MSDECQAAETEVANNKPHLLNFQLTITFDTNLHAHGIALKMDNGFPLGVAANALDKVKLRLLMDQLDIETAAIAAAQAGRVQEAKAMPPLAPRTRR